MTNKKWKLWELDRVSEEEYRRQQKFPLLIILDDIRSLNNIGSFFRTADAFNIEKIYLCGITACPPHREIQKTALGSSETVSWEYRQSIEQLVDELKQDGVFIVAIEQAQQTVFLQSVHELKAHKFALIFGNEVNGVRQELVDRADAVVEVPQFGTKHSLNVSVCAGIVMWEFAKPYFDRPSHTRSF